MEKTFKMLLLVIMMMSVGEAMVDTGDIAKELRIEMEEMKKQFVREISATKEDLLTTKEDLLTTKEDLLTTKEILFTTKEDLLTTKEDLLTTKEDLKAYDVSIRQLEKEISTTKEDLLTLKEDFLTKDASIKYLESGVSILKDTPFTFACGAQSRWSTSLATISYETLLYSSTNVDGPHGLDTSTGVFTAGFPGTYTVTWSLSIYDNAGDYYVYIYLRKNGATMDESLHSSQHYTTDGSSWVRDQGGRTLVLHLGRGDTLDLYCQDCAAIISYTTFCVSLSQADVE